MNTQYEINTKIENLNKAAEDAKKEMKNTLESYTKTVAEMVEKNLGWKLKNFDTSTMSVNNPAAEHGYEIDIYHGYDYNFKTKQDEWEFKINVAAMGSFNINEESLTSDYYKTVGKILSNVEFKTNLEKTLREFGDRIKVLREANDVCHNEIHKLEKELSYIEERDHQMNILESIAVAKAKKDEEKHMVVELNPAGPSVAVWKGTLASFCLEKPSTLEVAEKEFKALKKANKNNTYKVISINTLKW